MEDTSASRDPQIYDITSVSTIAQQEGYKNSLCSRNKDLTTCFSDIQRLYPSASTIHEIAQQAVGADDRDTIRRLVSIHTYLPIRWDAFVSVASGPILVVMIPVLSPLDKAEAAYRLRDPSLIEKYSQQISTQKREELAIQYRYHPDVPKGNILGQIRSMTLDDVVATLSPSNYVLILNYALFLGRTDIIDAIVSQYSERSTSLITENNLETDIAPAIAILSLVPLYEEAISGNYLVLPRVTIEYLLNLGYITVPTRIRAIVADDPEIINREENERDAVPSPYILTSNEIALILRYDAISMWRFLSPNISLFSILPLLPSAHGQIRRFILLSLSNGVSGRDDVLANTLLPNATAEDIHTSLEANIGKQGFEPLRMLLLIAAASRGYIEILDRYIGISREDVYIFLSVLASPSIYPSLQHEDLITLSDFLNYKFQGTSFSSFGTYMLAIWTDIADVFVPQSLWSRYLLDAIILGNISLTTRILHLYDIPTDIKNQAYLLLREYHGMNAQLYRDIEKILFPFY